MASFIQEQADPSLVWRGSANQVIHRFKQVNPSRLAHNRTQDLIQRFKI